MVIGSVQMSMLINTIEFSVYNIIIINEYMSVSIYGWIT